MLLLLAAAESTPAAPADSDTTQEAQSFWSGGVETALTNNYLWHGLSVNKGAILQPAAWLTYKGVSLYLWSSWTLTRQRYDIKRSEIEAALVHDFNLKDVVVEVYFNYYKYIDQPDDPDTGEAALILSRPIGLVKAKISLFCDVVEYPGALYVEPALEVEKELNAAWSAFGAVTIGLASSKFNSVYCGTGRTTISLLSMDGRISRTLAPGFYLQPWFQYNITLNTGLEGSLGKRSGCCGFTAGKEF